MKVTFVRTALATLIALVTAIQGYSQQSTPPPATDYTPAAPGAVTGQPATQTGIAPATSVETSPGIPAPVDQTRDAAGAATERSINAERAPATFPAPATPLTQPRAPRGDANITVPGGGRIMAGGGQGVDRAGAARGELGVWLVERGGPGVQVRRITEGSAADRAGLQPGDVILEINGQSATSPRGVAQMVQSLPAGETALVEFWRDGQANQVEIELQPLRAQHDVAFRGDPTLREMNVSTDLESRTARLEEQLAMVLQELRQMRQEMALMTSGSAPAAIRDGGVGTATTSASGFDAGTTTEPGAATTDSDTAFDVGTTTTEPAAGTTATERTAAEASAAATGTAVEADADAAAPETPPATEDDPFGGVTAEEPAATDTDATEEPATEDATAEEPAADADADADAAAPAEEEAATEDTSTETGTDDLFE